MEEGACESLCSRYGVVVMREKLGFAHRTAEGGCPHLNQYLASHKPLYGSRPNTATPFGVPTNTLPFTIIGVMYLLPEPNWSRPLLAWLLL